MWRVKYFTYSHLDGIKAENSPAANLREGKGV